MTTPTPQPPSSDNNEAQRIHDIAAAIVAVALVVGDVYLTVSGHGIPSDLGVATGAAVGYLFRSAVGTLTGGAIT